MVVGVVDDLRVLQGPGGHDRRVPVGVVVDETGRGVAMGSFNRDVIDVAATVSDLDDLVLPLLFLEPLSLVDVVGEGLLLSREPESNLLQESACGGALNLHVPAAIFLKAPSAQDSKID